jgi:hypothetical protein
MDFIIDSNDAKFGNFYDAMQTKILDHQNIYKDSWKTMSLGKLNDRLKAKFNEFDLTLNKDKLISIANLAMLLYIRMNDEQNK